jgi:hypothetical protein
MRVKFSLPSILFILVFSVQIATAKESAESLAIRAASENNLETMPAIEELRSLGPAGMQTLMKQYEAEIDRHITKPTTASSAEWQRITAALDAVSQQRNSYLSGLYWYIDLDEARKASAASGKPILSLRLLGKLTNELSCANSRFFRTVLYANSSVSAVMRDRFILHWQSVRPVPLITIDFGDGRKLERTITGNSIHYVLDSKGNVIEAFPGLYGPGAFERNLVEAEALFMNLKAKGDNEKFALLMKYYQTRANKISLAWLDELTKIKGKRPDRVLVQVDKDGQAISVMPLAVTKMATEANPLRMMMGGSESLGRVTDEYAWNTIAQYHKFDAVLDERSLSLIKKQNPKLSSDLLASMIEKLQHSVALDTVRNEYVMHPTLLAWMTNNAWRKDVDKFNEKVYAELFKTPKSDPWLGLLMPDTYTAIDNSGVVQ